MGLSKKAWLHELHPINSFLIRLRKTSLFKFYKNIIFRLNVKMVLPDNTARKWTGRFPDDTVYIGDVIIKTGIVWLDHPFKGLIDSTLILGPKSGFEFRGDDAELEGSLYLFIYARKEVR